MDLKDFIRESLEQICYGIREAQLNTKEKIKNCPIAPAFVAGDPVYKNSGSIDFDIAITVTTDQKLEAAGKANISVVGGGLKGEKNSSTENVHRISFSVPFHPAALQTKK